MAFDNGTKSLPKNYFLYLNHFKSLNLDLKTSSRIGSGKKFCQGRGWESHKCSENLQEKTMLSKGFFGSTRIRG